jgi:hypothetical protein
MGKRTRSKRKRRKTRRGGSPEDIRRLLEEIDRQVFVGDDDAGFNGRMTTLLESDDFSDAEDAALDEVEDHLERMVSLLTAVFHRREATDGLFPLSEMETVRTDVLAHLTGMMEAVQRLPMDVRQPLQTEVREELDFMNATFDQLRSKYPQV